MVQVILCPLALAFQRWAAASLWRPLRHSGARRRPDPHKCESPPTAYLFADEPRRGRGLRFHGDGQCDSCSRQTRTTPGKCVRQTRERQTRQKDKPAGPGDASLVVGFRRPTHLCRHRHKPTAVLSRHLRTVLIFFAVSKWSEVQKEKFRKRKYPVFELFWWDRIIMDEFHESESWVYRVTEMFKSIGA